MAATYKAAASTNRARVRRRGTGRGGRRLARSAGVEDITASDESDTVHSRPKGVVIRHSVWPPAHNYPPRTALLAGNGASMRELGQNTRLAAVANGKAALLGLQAPSQQVTRLL